MKITRSIKASTSTGQDMLMAFEQKLNQLEGGVMESEDIVTEDLDNVSCSGFGTTKYVLEDTYGVPQAGVETLIFDEYYELEEYLDEHPDVMERISEGYAFIREDGNIEASYDLDEFEEVGCSDEIEEVADEVTASVSDPEIDAAWEKLLKNGVEEQVLEVVTSLNGYNMETLNDISRVLYSLDIEDLDV